VDNRSLQYATLYPTANSIADPFLVNGGQILNEKPSDFVSKLFMKITSVEFAISER
jgi:hypothetical protein